MKGTTQKEKYRRCCGMDVHKETVVVRGLAADGQAGKPLKKVYGTFRHDLGRMRGWLKQLQATEIGMESSGVYQDRRIDPSFVPPPEIRRLRDPLRHRASLLEQRNQTHNKIGDLFETANLKLSSVASHLLRVSGRGSLKR